MDGNGYCNSQDIMEVVTFMRVRHSSFKNDPGDCNIKEVANYKILWGQKRDNLLPVGHKSGDSSGLPGPSSAPLWGRRGTGGGGGAGGDGVAGGGVGGVPQLLLLTVALLKPGQKS